MEVKDNYKVSDKLTFVIANDFRLLQVMSRFGISLGFGDKTIAEVCEQRGIDPFTFVSVLNFVKNGGIDYVINPEKLSLVSLLDYLKQTHRYFLEYQFPNMRRDMLNAIDCSIKNEVAFLVLKFFDEYVEEVRKHMKFEEEVTFKYVEQLLDGNGEVIEGKEHDNTLLAYHHEEIEDKLMDLKKIFLKDACPTKMGGQAVMEGIMMKGEKKTALAVRLPDGTIRVDTQTTKTYGKWMKIPLVRGVIAFADSLVYGTKTLMRSAEMLEEGDDEEYEPSRFEEWAEKKFGSKGLWNIMLYTSVILALAFSIGVFIILPTGAVNLMKHFTDSVFWLNFVEGVLRIAMFVAYVWAVSFMPDIRRVFQYHGAEHKTIHCFENGLELTPGNAQQFSIMF